MIFEELSVSGAYCITAERHIDKRGYFGRLWSDDEFDSHGLNSKIVQCSLSFNTKKGTLRGMHYQVSPFAECKTIRCTRGRVFDVIIDLRTDSPSYMSHSSLVLSAENNVMMYIPEGCAHGFLTLEDESEVFYQMSQAYHPKAARGVRWDDAAFNIHWPDEVTVINDPDSSYPNYNTGI